MICIPSLFLLVLTFQCDSVVFFLVYLLSHDVSRKMRQSLILLNEVHFSLLYLLQINLISDVLDLEGSFCREILLQLGTRAFFFLRYYVIIL